MRPVWTLAGYAGDVGRATERRRVPEAGTREPRSGAGRKGLVHGRWSRKEVRRYRPLLFGAHGATRPML
jgi:hypothetical protein